MKVSLLGQYSERILSNCTSLPHNIVKAPSSLAWTPSGIIRFLRCTTKQLLHSHKSTVSTLILLQLDWQLSFHLNHSMGIMSIYSKETGYAKIMLTFVCLFAYFVLLFFLFFFNSAYHFHRLGIKYHVTYYFPHLMNWASFSCAWASALVRLFLSGLKQTSQDG